MFRSTVDIVRVEATVLDKDRRPMRGLNVEDFIVAENGRERPVVAFAPVELPPAAPVQAAGWLRDAPRDVVGNDGAEAGRLIVIAFDWSIRMYDQELARRIALAAVDGLGAADEASVVFTRPNVGVGKPQGLTADRALLRAAINQPFGVALTDPHPDRNKRIIDPEGYESGDCFCAADWPWSTHRATAGLEDAPSWLHLDWLRWAFRADMLPEAQRCYQAYVRDSAGLMWSFDAAGALGTARFKKAVAETLARSRENRLIPDDCRRWAQLPLEQLFSGEEGDSRSRDALILVAHVTHGYRLAEIARFLAVAPAASVRP